MDKIKPFPGFIAIQPDEVKEQEDDGIFIPKSDDKTYTGTVIALGQEKENEPIICKVGDKVLFNKWVSNEVTIEKKKYQFLRANEVLAVILK